MKWKSPIIGDLRNQLAESIVGSTWRGRNYFRNYVIPANPKTLPQQAFREVHRLAVETWQLDYKNDAEAYAAWNTLGKTLRLPGFNKFIQLCRRNQIYIEVLELTQYYADVRVHYFNALNHYDTGLAQSSQGVNWTQPKDFGTLTYKSWDYEDFHLTESGIYAWYLNSRIVHDLLPTDKIEKSRHAHWTPDETTGGAHVASVAIAVVPCPCDPPFSGVFQFRDHEQFEHEWEWVDSILVRIDAVSYPEGFTGDVNYIGFGNPAPGPHVLLFENGLTTHCDGEPFTDGHLLIESWIQSWDEYVFAGGALCNWIPMP